MKQANSAAMCEKMTASAPGNGFCPCSVVWPFLVVVASTVYPRLIALGFFPYMDEGFYAFCAQFIHHSVAQGHGVPDEGGFLLYPLLLSWLCALPGNALLWLRLADMLVAACAGWLFCRFLERESTSSLGGMLLGLAFLCAMNAPDVIDAGFKNSIFAAYLFLLLALQLSRGIGERDGRWYGVGALTAVAVLLREPFVIFSVLGVAAIWRGRGWDACWRYALGGMATGLGMLTLIGGLRGGITNLLQAYSSAIYAPEAGRVWKKFVGNGLDAAFEFWPLLALTLLALGLLCADRLFRRSRADSGRALFWLFAALLPLLEPLAKLGFIYHFAVSLPGCAGLCALAWKNTGRGTRNIRQTARILVALACLWQFTFLPSPAQARLTSDAWRSFPAPDWPAYAASQSSTLQAAQVVRAATPPGGALSVSSFAYFLYPATGFLPPSLSLSDLSRTYIACGFERQCLRDALRADPPATVAVGFTTQDHSATFTPEVLAAVEGSGLYEFVTAIPADANKDYGWMGYLIYRKRAGS